MSLELFTVGHSTHSLERFIELLDAAGVTAIADVRSQPYSRFTPQFNRPELSRALKQHGIAYVFVGKELGARPDDPGCYEHGQVRYSRIAQTPLFKSGIARVLAGAERFRIALMCAEKEPLECHRTLLVGRAIQQSGSRVSHIHASGVLETYDDSMLRLLDLTGLPREDMFRTTDDLLADALRRQEQKVAYIEQSETATAPDLNT